MAKSQFRGIPEYAAVKQFNITQTKDSIRITRVLTDASGQETTSSETLSVDGKPCSKILDDGRTKSSVITWSDDKQVMSTVSSYSLPNEPKQIHYQLTQTWKLNENNNELLVVLTSPKYSIGVVYNKQ